MVFQGFIKFNRLLLSHRYLIVSMAKREIASQYVGSFLGFVWTFIKPLVLISVFWFVFSVGFRSQPMGGDIPFVVWLAAGMAPWFCFTDIVINSTGAVVGAAPLVKKTLFPSQILPIIKLLSGLITHSVFLIILIGLLLFQGIPCLSRCCSSFIILSASRCLRWGFPGLSQHSMFLFAMSPR